MGIKRQINSNTVTVGNFNTLLTSMDKSSREKTSKETMALNDILDHKDFTDILKIFPWK